MPLFKAEKSAVSVHIGTGCEHLEIICEDVYAHPDSGFRDAKIRIRGVRASECTCDNQLTDREFSPARIIEDKSVESESLIIINRLYILQLRRRQDMQNAIVECVGSDQVDDGPSVGRVKINLHGSSRGGHAYLCCEASPQVPMQPSSIYSNILREIENEEDGEKGKRPRDIMKAWQKQYPEVQKVSQSSDAKM